MAALRKANADMTARLGGIDDAAKKKSDSDIRKKAIADGETQALLDKQSADLAALQAKVDATTKITNDRTAEAFGKLPETDRTRLEKYRDSVSAETFADMVGDATAVASNITPPPPGGGGTTGDRAPAGEYKPTSQATEFLERHRPEVIARLKTLQVTPNPEKPEQKRFSLTVQKYKTTVQRIQSAKQIMSADAAR